MTDELDDDVAGTRTANDNLSLLVDVYKHHWDLFIKALAVYLVACSVLVGYGVSQSSDAFNQLFSGVATVVASVVALGQLGPSLSWLRDIARRIDRLCARQKFTSIPFVQPIKIVRNFRLIVIIIMITGIFYTVHVVLTRFVGFNYMPQLTTQ